MTNNRTETQEFKQEFLRMASYIDCLLECSDTQKETLLNFIARLSEYMPWYEDDDFEVEEHTPERKKGKWMLHEDGWYCSACELYPSFDCDPEEKGIPYCPNCGARMN